MAKPHSKPSTPHSEPPEGTVATGTLQEEIALRAYYRHCERRGAPGSAMEDWLAAEQEVLAELRAQHHEPVDID